MTAAELVERVPYHMEQHRDEIIPFVEWLSARNPHHVLEIGVRHGGTSYLWHELVDGLVIGVDWIGQDSLGASETIRLHAELARTLPRFRSWLGDSHHPETLRRVVDLLGGQALDLLFIDGDHSFEGALQDLTTYGPLVRQGGIIAFHDIVDSAFMRQVGHGVPRLWQQLQAQHTTFEFSIHGEWGGIGALVNS